MAKRARRHPVLGRMTWDESLTCWDAEVDVGTDPPIRLAIMVEEDWEEVEPTVLFDIAAKYLAWARKSEKKVRSRIADDMLALYNRTWADEDPDEGTPRMSRKEFLANIHTSGINLYYTGSAEWYYSCGEMFGGHEICISLDHKGHFKGKAFLIG